MNGSRWLLLTLVFSLSLAACDFIESFAPPPDEEEIGLTQTARAADETATRAALATATYSPVPTATPTATVPPTATFTASPAPTVTATPTPTAPALSAECAADVSALTACVNGEALPRIFKDGAPDHRIANNTDPATLYRNEAVLTLLSDEGVTLIHNYYTRPVNCPFTTACLLHLLMIEFGSVEDALAFFDLVTETGLEGETALLAPNAADWDAAKCAIGTRPATTAGAPDFAVLYCSVSEGELHWGFNLSAYDGLPEGFVEGDLEDLMEVVHQYLSVWQ